MTGISSACPSHPGLSPLSTSDTTLPYHRISYTASPGSLQMCKWDFKSSSVILYLCFALPKKHFHPPYLYSLCCSHPNPFTSSSESSERPVWSSGRFTVLWVSQGSWCPSLPCSWSGWGSHNPITVHSIVSSGQLSFIFCNHCCCHPSDSSLLSNLSSLVEFTLKWIPFPFYLLSTPQSRSSLFHT